MAGDYTRFRYNPLKDTSGVQMQQGRVLLDQDWNEHVQLEDRRWRAETIDIMGRAVVPLDTRTHTKRTGFEISLDPVSGLLIGVGRMYVDGLLPENHGVDPTDHNQRTYDPVLGELIGNSPIPYKDQPYLPKPLPPALPEGNYFVYLDVWERELTYLEDPGLIDQAVAVDTGTRLQTMWQVRALQDNGNLDCSLDPFNVRELASSAGRLTTAAAGVPTSKDPCIVPASGGYRGAGNRCYRVEIHNGGPMGTATFKWSRDNASVATAVTGINASRDTLTVLTKRDSVLRFQPGDWVEVTDDFLYFKQQPGELHQVKMVDDVNLTIQLKDSLTGDFNEKDPLRHTRVVRWDQKGIVRDPLNNTIIDVDTNAGLIPVPAAGTTIVLEDGIQITFGIDTSMAIQNFHALDYWMFDARVVDASVEILTEAPPRGILHHYAWLARVTSGVVSDCRNPWPPDRGTGESKSCDCSACVNAADHNAGTFTLQGAINKVQSQGGGKVCLEPGTYNISTTVLVSGTSAIEISGHGMPRLAASAALAPNPIIQVQNAKETRIDGIAFAGTPGILLIETSFVTIERCRFSTASQVVFLAPAQVTPLPAIALAGNVQDASIRDNFFDNVPAGVGTVLVQATANRPQLFLANTSIRDNHMECSTAGVTLSDPNTPAQLLNVSFVDNLVQSVTGFDLRCVGLDVFVERNSFVVTPDATGGGADSNAAILCSASQARISDNHISPLQNPGNPSPGGLSPGNGIVLVGLPNRSIFGSQIAGNFITGLQGNGTLVKAGTAGTRLLETIIARNQLFNLGSAGMTIEKGVIAFDLDITGNSLVSVGLDAAGSAPLVAIMLATALDVNVSGNAIEAVAPDATMNASRWGILLSGGTDVRIAGNRIVEVGPAAQINPSAGVLVFSSGRLDLVDNEVRRAIVLPPNRDSSFWSALQLAGVGADLNVRGNVLESFGSAPTVTLIGPARSCIFSDNQCFLDNARPSDPALVVDLAADNIVASGNFVQGPVSPSGAGIPVMNLQPKNVNQSLTVLGNITSGLIQAAGGPLLSPWQPLNVINV